MKAINIASKEEDNGAPSNQVLLDKKASNAMEESVFLAGTQDGSAHINLVNYKSTELDIHQRTMPISFQVKLRVVFLSRAAQGTYLQHRLIQLIKVFRG